MKKIFKECTCGRTMSLVQNGQGPHWICICGRKVKATAKDKRDFSEGLKQGKVIALLVRTEHDRAA